MRIFFLESVHGFHQSLQGVFIRLRIPQTRAIKYSCASHWFYLVMIFCIKEEDKEDGCYSQINIALLDNPSGEREAKCYVKWLKVKRLWSKEPASRSPAKSHVPLGPPGAGQGRGFLASVSCGLWVWLLSEKSSQHLVIWQKDLQTNTVSSFPLGKEAKLSLFVYVTCSPGLPRGDSFTTGLSKIHGKTAPPAFPVMDATFKHMGRGWKESDGRVAHPTATMLNAAVVHTEELLRESILKVLITRKSLLGWCVMRGVHWIRRGHHCASCTHVKSLHCTLETNTMYRKKHFYRRGLREGGKVEAMKVERN